MRKGKYSWIERKFDSRIFLLSHIESHNMKEKNLCSFPK